MAVTDYRPTEADPSFPFFVAGGTMPRDVASYVERQADRDLLEALRRGEFCYVLTSRQMGKSSLMVRTAARLREEGIAVAVLDLTALGQNLEVEQWYAGLLAALGEQLDREPELFDAWERHERLSPLPRWIAAIREALLAEERSFVLFIDEIDAVRNLPFPTDEFFAAIRACYNRRGEAPEFERLTFCLLGVAAPTDLIRDPRTTPFNIGRRIELTDFTPEEAAPLAAGLAGEGGGRGSATDPSERVHGRGGEAEGPLPGVREALLKRILYWTGGHPYLTQCLCQAVASGNFASPSPLAADLPPRPLAPGSGPSASQEVDRACEALYLTPGAREREDNLLFVRDRLLRSEVDRAGLLDLYGQVRRGRWVPADDTDELVTVLRLSGIVRTVPERRSGSARLAVRNRIYERVFDTEWVVAHMPEAELRRQRAAYRRGLLRAASVGGGVLVVVGALAITALDAAGRARYNADRANASMQITQQSLLDARRERERADQAAVAARQAGGRERAQRVRAEAALSEAERARLRALEQEQRALAQRRRAEAQQRIAEERRLEAERARLRAQRAERDAKEKLWQSYLDQARARRFSGRPGRRFASLDALSRAAALGATPGLRDEAIACMTLVDLRLLRSFPPRIETTAFALDPSFTWYARGDETGRIRLSRIEDDRSLGELPGQGVPVRPMRISPDGRLLAAAYRPDGEVTGELVVWDVPGRRALFRVRDGTYYDAIDFTPDGRRIAAGRKDGSIRLYDPETGAEVGRFEAGRPPYYLRFHPDGRRVAVSSLSAPGVAIHDVEQGTIVTTLATPAPIFGLAWRPDGRALAAGGSDWNVYLWERAVPAVSPVVLEGHEGEAIRVAFSHGGDLLLSASWDGTTRVWDLPTRRPQVSAPGNFVGFSPDDGRLLIGGARGSLETWQLATADECRTFRHRGAGKGPWTAAIRQDGRLLATAGSDGVRLWDLARGKEVRAFSAPEAQSVRFHPKTGELFSSGGAGAQRWPDGPAEGDLGRVPSEPPEPLFAGKGYARLALDGEGRLVAASHQNHIHVRPLGQDGPPMRLEGQRAAELLIDVSPDGRWIAAGTWGGNGVRVWDAGTGRLVRELPIPRAIYVLFSPDGKWLLTAAGSEYQFWKVGSWQPGRVVPRGEPEGVPAPPAFTPDGKTVAVAHTRRVVLLLDVATGRELARLEAPNVQQAIPLCFNGDGRLLVTRAGPELFQVWDLRAIRRRLAEMGLDW